MNNNICQFYIILGNENNITKKEDNVYINATNITDIKELSKIIINTYKEKAKEGKTVASEIIFLIPNEKYKDKTEQIIKELKVNGKIEIIQKEAIEEKKEIIEQKIEVKEVKVQEQEIEEQKIEVKEEIKKDEKEEIKVKAPVYKKETNTYKGTPSGLKNKKQNNLPAIIIFIISLIFFIISLLLLILV